MTSYCFMRFCKVLCQTWNHWRSEDLSWDQIGTQCYALDPDIVLTTCLHLTPYMYMHCSSGFSREFIRRCQLGSSFSPSRIAKHGGLPSIFEQTFICPHILWHIPRKSPILPPFYPFRSWLYPRNSLNKSDPFMDQESLSLARLAICAAAVAFVLETQRALSLCRRWFGAQTAHPVGCHEKVIFAHVFGVFLGGWRWIKYIYEMEVMMISWYL